MVDTNWTIHAREFVNCNCSYGCPCQFNGLPTYGDCKAVAGMQIEQGHHGETKLDGLKFVGVFRWPGAIHEGKGEAAIVIESGQPKRNAKQCCALSGQDTKPGATISTCSPRRSKSCTIRFCADRFQVDVEGRRRDRVAGVTEGRGEPISIR